MQAIPINRTDYCQFLIVSQKNYSLTYYAEHANKCSHDVYDNIQSFKIDKNKIREVIGPGGKVIREICDMTSAKIEISDDGNVTVSAIGKEKLDMAVEKIKSIAFDPEIGGIFNEHSYHLHLSTHPKVLAELLVFP